MANEKYNVYEWKDFPRKTNNRYVMMMMMPRHCQRDVGRRHSYHIIRVHLQCTILLSVRVDDRLVIVRKSRLIL
jgi:hypothetical protein